MIWLASFPRSGNTFARNVLFQAYGLQSTEVNQKVFAYSSTYREFPVVKTHLLPSDLEYIDDNDIIVYLVRDGRDALVSIAHHRSNIIEPGSDLIDNLTLAINAQGGSYFGGWAKNVAEWLSIAHIVIRFEDLIEDPIRELEKIRALDTSLPKPDIKKIPTFQTQKEGNPKYGPPKMTSLFFRKGKVGDWRNTFTDDLHNVFWKKSADVMNTLNYKFNGDVADFTWKAHRKNLKGLVPFHRRILKSLSRKKQFITWPFSQKLSLSPQIIYLQCLHIYDPFFELIKQNTSEQSLAILDIDSKNRISLTDGSGQKIKSTSKIKVLVSRISWHYMKMAVTIKTDPDIVSGIIEPAQHVVTKYLERSKLDRPTILELNEDLEHFIKSFENRNILSRTISPFTENIDHCWTPKNYRSLITALCERLNWSLTEYEFQNVELSPDLSKDLANYNKKDIDIYKCFSTPD